MEKNVWDRSYATLERWGRNVNVPPQVFERYLFKLGYLDEQDKTPTALGGEHCVWAHKCGQWKLLWDYDTFLEVKQYRAGQEAMCERGAEFDDYLEESHMGNWEESK